MAGRGLVKQKEYDWKDSNMAMFGSDTEKNVKKESAATEPAWRSAGKRIGLQIWRIENFKVKAWPRDDYGTFYDGDSYIILNTYKNEDSDALLYDVHFWIGAHSTQDEYGTAAYKTVELDTFLDDKAVQHREVMKHESDLFKTYFRALSTLSGGVKSAFKNVLPANYQPRLLRVKGTTINNCIVSEVTLSKGSLCSDDVFILDMGTRLYQWNGINCDKDEKFKAMQVCQEIKSKNGGKAKVDTYDEGDISKEHPFYKLLGDKPSQKGDPGDYDEFVKTLFRFSEPQPGRPPELREIAKGRISKDSLNRNDVFLLDTGRELFIWVGSNASVDEKRFALKRGHDYLITTEHPLAAITVFAEGSEKENFINAFDG